MFLPCHSVRKCLVRGFRRDKNQILWIVEKNEFYRLLYSRGWFFGEDEEDEGKESKRWKGHSLVELVAANSRTYLKDWVLEVTAMVMELWKEASGDFSMNMAQLRVFTMKSTHC